MKQIIYILSICGLCACSSGDGFSGSSGDETGIFPDYAGITAPVNIAPLNFSVLNRQKAAAVFTCGGYSFKLSSDRRGRFVIPPKKWRKLLEQAKGHQFDVKVRIKGAEEQLFSIFVAEEPVDEYIAYRLIEPGYVVYNRMGIYQRDLQSYRQSVILENEMTGDGCMNCHSFCCGNPDRMMFHLRQYHAGTVLIDGDRIEFLNTTTGQTISPLVYPSWHPSGQFIAFSVNTTEQIVHQQQRVEVFDKQSDVVVYDVQDKTILASPLTFSESSLETFPAFSPDGRTLYFCSGKSCAIPDSTPQLKYHLCSVAFDPATKMFGDRADTLYNADTNGMSVSFPRISPDGRFLVCTLSSYGTFPIWHKDADLYLIDLQTGEGKYLETVNSDDTESYHSWSSNSRWLVFSSRRLDGLYTRPYFVYINGNGEAAKPFLLPQKEPETYYQSLLKSYNIPEFITGKVRNRAYRMMRMTEDSTTAENITFELRIKN
ncbi:MAG: hypothetical protein LBL42_02940 [Tannerella sp.]|jgi:hypothetical protein|nr:hypothetical protein [Tannerella sp.]